MAVAAARDEDEARSGIEFRMFRARFLAWLGLLIPKLQRTVGLISSRAM